MTRETQIRQTAISEQKGLMESCDWRGGFVSGAKWADKTMLDNVCRWLDMNLNDYITEGSREGMSKEKREEMFKDLRKDMNL